MCVVRAETPTIQVPRSFGSRLLYCASPCTMDECSRKKMPDGRDHCGSRVCLPVYQLRKLKRLDAHAALPHGRWAPATCTRPRPVTIVSLRRSMNPPSTV